VRSAVSRILFHAFSQEALRCPFIWCDQDPGSCPDMNHAVASGQAARSPVLSCTAWGFSCPAGYPDGRWALTPPFHPFPAASAGWFVFCDTIRHPAITTGCPRFHGACCLVVSGLSSPLPERASANLKITISLKWNNRQLFVLFHRSRHCVVFITNPLIIFANFIHVEF
jgi:hypothetical protein